MAVFSVPLDFVSLVCDRLAQTGASPADRHAALAVLGVALAQLGIQTYACNASVVDLARQLDMSPGQFVTAVKLLGRVGAVTMGERHGERRIAVTPPGGLQRGRPRQLPEASLEIAARSFRSGRVTA